MKLVFLGDSITRGTFTKVGDHAPLSLANPNFADLVSEKLFVSDYRNYGLNGISYSATSPVNSGDAVANLCQRVKSFDMVIIAGGTNDYGTDVEIGSYLDTEDVSFCGAVRKTLSVLKEKEPNGKIVVVLPIPRQNERIQNKKGYSLQDYRNVLGKMAEEYGCILVHGERLGVNPDKEQDRMQYIYDGTHLNEEGHVMYADLIYFEIKDKENDNGKNV